MLEHGVRIPALVSWVLASCRGSDTHAPRSVSLCAVSSSLGRALSSPRVFSCVARSSCFYRLLAFILYLVLCGTQLVNFIGCVFSRLVWTRGLWVFSLAACSCLVLHMAGELFAGHVLVFLFCFQFSVCHVLSCQFVLSPVSHIVTCILINFPQLFSLVTLLVCSLYNLLVFAVPCGFVAICWVVVRLVSCLVQPCQFVFPPTGLFLFVLFIYYLLIKSQFSSCIWVFALFSPLNLTLLVLLIMGLIH